MEDKRGYVPSAAPKRDLAAANRRYVWDYTGSRTKLLVLTVLAILVGIGLCLFPVWPYFMKRGAQLLSMTTLVVLLGGMAVRWLVFGIVWLCGYSFWLLPNLFEEDGDVSMFSPVYSLERAGPGQGWLRASSFVGLAAVAYYLYTQPTDFERFVGSQRDFLTELYSGALIGDVNQADKDFVRSTGVDLDAEVHDDVVSDVIIDAVTNAALHDDGDSDGGNVHGTTRSGDEDGDGIDESELLEELRQEMSRDL